MHNESLPTTAEVPPSTEVVDPNARCSSCKHFDLEEGQAVIAQFPAFLSVASLISPAQIGRHVVREYDRPCRLCDGKGKVLLGGAPDLADCRGCEGAGKVLEQELSAPAAPLKAKWGDCGACMKDSVVVWGGDKRSCWEPA